jgi:calcineurin-like phosphoesterase family protein
MEIETTNNVWVTADTHYNHKNICRGITAWRTPEGLIPIDDTRDFPTLARMNYTIMSNINNVVMQDDILIHLGDWSFGGFDSIREFKSVVVCKNIYLFLGNHDKHIKTNRDDIRDIFTYVDKEEEEFVFNGHQFHLNHYPIVSWNDIKDGAIHLHGHSHLMGDRRFGKGKRMDVGIDGHPEFRPYNLKDEIIPLMEKRLVVIEMGILDHHLNNRKNV